MRSGRTPVTKHRLSAIAVTAILGFLIATATAFAGPRVYVANLGSDSVSVVDVDTNLVVATIPLQQFSRPQGLALTPDAAKLYVTHENANFVSVIDTATNTVTTIVTVGSSPRGIDITPDGTRAFVANTF